MEARGTPETSHPAEPLLGAQADAGSGSAAAGGSAAFPGGSASSGAHGNSSRRRVLGVASVVFIVYFNVCGGPWGSEEMLSDAGPLPGIVGIFLFAALWGMPVALVTSEMSSAFPDDGGYSLWVGEAFGGFWGFQESYYSWVSGIVDNAIYPGLVYSAIVNVISAAQIDHTAAGVDTVTAYMAAHPLVKYLIKLGIATLFMLPNLLCIRSVGKSTIYLAAFVMAPFVVLICVCIPQLEPGRLFLPPWNAVNASSQLFSTFGANISGSSSSSSTAPSSADGGYLAYPTSWGAGWSDLLSVLYWNMSGFDCISTCAGEVKDVGQTIYRALSIALAIIVVSYVLPLSFATMASTPQNLATWGNDDGECSWACIARNVGGEWLMIWVFISSIAGNAGMYVAEMFEDSWQLRGMAEQGIMPKFLAKRHPTYETPVNAVLVSYLLIAGLCCFDFMDNLSINNFFSCGSCLLEIFAFLKLRMYNPELTRPFRVPLDSWKLVLMCAMPIFLGAFVLVSCFNQGFGVAMTNGAAVVFGVLLYFGMRNAGYRYEYSVKRQRLLSESEAGSDAGNGSRNGAAGVDDSSGGGSGVAYNA